MAKRCEDDLQSYDVSRFQGEVREDILCSICQEVPKDPRLCQHKDHIFCFAHISRHLVQNSQTCPVCRDPLNHDTLRRPTGFLKNYLEDLKIKCDHHNRGCPDYVRLEHLQRHVQECGYAPVVCPNKGCGTEINRKDIECHKKNSCQNGHAKCHDCKNIKGTVDEMNHYIKRVEGKQNKMMESINEMTELLEKIMMMTNRTFEGNSTNESGASAMDSIGLIYNQDIIIIGGRFSPGDDCEHKGLNTVEKYNIVEEKSSPLPRLNLARIGSASCVHNNDVLVVGGSDGTDGTEMIKVLKMNQHPLRWTMFKGKLPVKLHAHDVVVYQGKLYAIGGYNSDEKKLSNAIYEIALGPPYTAERLTRMNGPRKFHRAELVYGKLFILGGTTTGSSKDAIDSVVVYDFSKDEFRPCPSLPRPVCRMSTVIWGHMIIIVGGQDKDNKSLNDVIMYDTENGQSEKLHPMIHRRSGCSAVIINDAIFVFGGWNLEHGFLSSVESFTVSGDGWKELAGMTGKRQFASAVVKPL